MTTKPRRDTSRAATPTRQDTEQPHATPQPPIVTGDVVGVALPVEPAPLEPTVEDRAVAVSGSALLAQMRRVLGDDNPGLDVDVYGDALVEISRLSPAGRSLVELVLLLRLLDDAHPVDPPLLARRTWGEVARLLEPGSALQPELDGPAS